MYQPAELPIIMPVLGVIFTLVIVVALIVVKGKQKTTEISAISQKSFEQLTKEIKQENAAIKTELADIKKKVSSMEKMMNDVQ